jgi:hypothetical protein
MIEFACESNIVREKMINENIHWVDHPACTDPSTILLKVRLLKCLAKCSTRSLKFRLVEESFKVEKRLADLIED